MRKYPKTYALSTHTLDHFPILLSCADLNTGTFTSQCLELILYLTAWMIGIFNEASHAWYQFSHGSSGNQAHWQTSSSLIHTTAAQMCAAWALHREVNKPAPSWALAGDETEVFCMTCSVPTLYMQNRNSLERHAPDTWISLYSCCIWLNIVTWYAWKPEPGFAKPNVP